MYNTVCILYPHRLVHLIFPTLEEEGVLLIYNFPSYIGLQTGGGKKVMDKVHLDC